MSLTPEQREQVRLSLLRYGGALASQHFTLGLAVQYLKSEGFPVERWIVEAEIGYLEEKGLLKRQEKIVSPENRRWSTSANGRDYLAEQGLE